MSEDPSAAELLVLFRAHGVTGEVREVAPRENDEAVFVVATVPAEPDQLAMALQEILRRKVWITPASSRWMEVSEPLSTESQP